MVVGHTNGGGSYGRVDFFTNSVIESTTFDLSWRDKVRPQTSSSCLRGILMQLNKAGNNQRTKRFITGGDT